MADPSPSQDVSTPRRAAWLRWLPHKWGRRGASVVIMLLLIASFFIGWDFLRFVAKIRPATVASVSAADGIVVLTGGSERIEEAVALFESGQAKRLLITGVNPGTSATALQAITPRAANLLACCIDLDRNALNTLGNALETARWVHEQRFKSIIVVTASYHIPRAMMELRRVLPDTVLMAYPVVPNGFDLDHWWSSPATARALMLEYIKYSVARLRWRFDKPTAHDIVLQPKAVSP